MSQLARSSAGTDFRHPDVYRRKLMTSKVGPRTEKVNTLYFKEKEVMRTYFSIL